MEPPILRTSFAMRKDAENYNECTIEDDEGREGSDMTEGYSVVDLGGDLEEV